MTSCPYAELANKIEVHHKLEGSPGYYLSATDVETIIEALRYTSEHECPTFEDQQSRKADV